MEQLVGALAAISVALVGALTWLVRQRQKENGNPERQSFDGIVQLQSDVRSGLQTLGELGKTQVEVLQVLQRIEARMEQARMEQAIAAEGTKIAHAQMLEKLPT